MYNISYVIKWVVRNFFFLSIVVFIIFYLRWFRLTPFVFGDDPTTAFIGGCFLMIIYGTLATFFARTKSVALKVMLAIVNIMLLTINALYLIIHIPNIETTAMCNGIKYYITHGAPLGDEQWTYVQVSKWRGIFYESYFWGYSGANEIKCDVDNKEALFLDLYGDPPTLTIIDGENSQRFYRFAGAQLGDDLFFLSEDWSLLDNCNSDKNQVCSVFIYTLYTCKSNYTECNSLPISYTAGYVDYLELRANETTHEVSLFQQYLGSDDESLVFTYGENSHCYVDGCTINNK